MNNYSTAVLRAEKRHPWRF